MRVLVLHFGSVVELRLEKWDLVPSLFNALHSLSSKRNRRPSSSRKPLKDIWCPAHTRTTSLDVHSYFSFPEQA